MVALFAAFFSEGDSLNPLSQNQLSRTESSFDPTADSASLAPIVPSSDGSKKTLVEGVKVNTQTAPQNFFGTAQRIKKSFKELQDHKNDVKAQADRQARIEALAEDPEALKILQMALSDLNRCIEIFGDDQAVVRLLGIEVLNAAAKKGQLDHLESAINGTMHELKSGPWRKSRDADLSDLMDGWIQAKGQSNIYDNPALLFKYFPYDPELRAPIATAIRYVFQARLENPEFIARFLPYMKGE